MRLAEKISSSLMREEIFRKMPNFQSLNLYKQLKFFTKQDDIDNDDNFHHDPEARGRGWGLKRNT